MVETIVFVLIFVLGFCLGVLFRGWLISRTSGSGVIHVTHSRGRTLYSLELSDYPEALEFKKVVVFKVESGDEPSDRE